MNEFDALDARLKLRRELLSFYHLLTQRFNEKTVPLIENSMRSIKKKLETIKITKEFSSPVEFAFSDSINQSLSCHLAPREVIRPNREEALEDILEMISQVEAIISLSKKDQFYEILEDCVNFSKLPKNVLCKAYLDISMFQNGGKSYFGFRDFTDITKNIFISLGLAIKDIQDQKLYEEFIYKATIVISDYIAKRMRNRFRQRREFTKSYNELTILIYEAVIFVLIQNSVEGKLFETKKNSAFNLLLFFAFHITMKLMIEQLKMGFEIDLYDEVDHPFVLFYIDYLMGVSDNNYKNFMVGLDKDVLIALQKRIPGDKKLKKISELQKTMLRDAQYNKCVLEYYKNISRLSFFYLDKGFIPCKNTKETLELRFINRFKIFENCHYVKKLTYPAYQEIMEEYKAENEVKLKILNRNQKLSMD